MENTFSKNFVFNNGEAVLNIENVATFLGISTATVRNWVKCGHLQTVEKNEKYFFDKKEVEEFELKIRG